MVKEKVCKCVQLKLELDYIIDVIFWINETYTFEITFFNKKKQKKGKKRLG